MSRDLLAAPNKAIQRAARDNPSGSFLLRIWTEPREADGEAPRVRVFLRNLKTGEESYLGDLDQLGDTVLRQFQGPDDPE
jgi:hypothetical protein